MLIPKEEGLIGKQVIVHVESTHKWHITGKIVEYSPMEIEVGEDYWTFDFQKEIAITEEMEAEVKKNEPEEKEDVKEG